MDVDGALLWRLLAQFGRAYPLFGPVDVGWTATQILKVSHVFPNVNFDQTAGARVRLGRGFNLGLFGGVSENVSYITNRVMQQAFEEKGPKLGFYSEIAPHAAVALWGPLPGLSDARFELIGRQQWNKDTTIQKAEAALLTQLFSTPTRLAAVACSTRTIFSTLIPAPSETAPAAARPGSGATPDARRAAASRDRSWSPPPAPPPG